MRSGYVLVAVLATVGAAPTPDPVAFRTWVEPRERSFSIEVPQGWEVNGGLNWTGPLDPQMFVHAKSPPPSPHAPPPTCVVATAERSPQSRW